MSTHIARIWWIAALCLAMPLTGSASTPVGALLDQADAVRSSNPEQFQTLLQKINAAKGQATPKQQEHLRYLNAYSQGYAGHYDVAIAALGRLISNSPDVDMKFRAGALMVNSYAVTRQFTEGLRQLEQTLALAGRVRNPELRQHGLMVAALIYNQIGQYKLGLRYANRILAEPAPERTRCFAGQHQQEALLKLKALPADDTPLLQLVAQCEAQGEKVVANAIRALLARKWAALGQRDKAIKLLREYLPEVEATRYPRLIGEIHSLLAEYLLADGNIDGAEYHAQAAIAQSASMLQSLPLVAAYKTRYEIAERRNDLATALAQYRNYAEADKAYLNDIKTREMAYQIVRQETLQKTQEIELLNRQNKVLHLEQRVSRQGAQNSRLVFVLLLLLLATIGYWAYKIKRVQLTLRRWAETDALTGICNRHHFTLLSEQTLAQCARDGESAALIMFDLDHFKSINDLYGHVTGDWVLKRVAEACSTFCRRIDHLGRLGGEEFAFLMYGCDLRDALRMANDCRVRLAMIDTTESGYRFTVTASFGATTTALSGYDLAKLLSHADQMLYRAKREGRNRVCAFDGEATSVFDGHAAARREDPANASAQRHTDAPQGA